MTLSRRHHLIPENVLWVKGMVGARSDRWIITKGE